MPPTPPRPIAALIETLVALAAPNLDPAKVLDDRDGLVALVEAWNDNAAQAHQALTALSPLLEDPDLVQRVDALCRLLEPGRRALLLRSGRVAWHVEWAAPGLAFAYALSKQKQDYDDRVNRGTLGVAKLDMDALFGND